MLELLGLEGTPQRVYQAMLAQPDANIAELSSLLDLDDEQLHAALDRLTELSLLRPSWNNGRPLHPVKPEIGLQMLLARQQADLVTQQGQVAEACASMARLIAECADMQPACTDASSERIEGIDAIRDRLFELACQVKDEVIAFAPEGRQTEENLKAARPQDTELLARGVRMRTLYVDSVRKHPPSKAYGLWLVDNGAQVRTTPSLPIRMVIFDRLTAVIPSDPDDSASAALAVRTPGALTALCALFESIWASACPLNEPEPHDEMGLTNQERELLRFLADGMTDEAAAKRLGTSVRTVNRLAAGVMHRLSARSRFEAGVRAAQRGWV